MISIHAIIYRFWRRGKLEPFFLLDFGGFFAMLALPPSGGGDCFSTRDAAKNAQICAKGSEVTSRKAKMIGPIVLWGGLERRTAKCIWARSPTGSKVASRSSSGVKYIGRAIVLA
jgi:hypothetical protein